MSNAAPTKTPKAKKPPFKASYSGEKSKSFWRRINAIRGEAHSEAYTLGVVLQNIEGDCLRFIELAEHRAHEDAK